MATVRLPTVLRPLAENAAVIDVSATTFGGLRDGIRERYPALADRLYETDGRLREFVGVFVDGEDGRDLGDDAQLAERSEVVLLPAISGGCAPVEWPRPLGSCAAGKTGCSIPTWKIG